MFPARALFRTAAAAVLAALPLVYSASMVSGDEDSRRVPSYGSLGSIGELKLPSQDEEGYRSISFDGSKDRLLASYKKSVDGISSGNFFRLSYDGGKTFHAETDLSKPAGPDLDLSFVKPFVLREGIAAIGYRSGDLYFLRKGDRAAEWSSPVRINDEISSVGIEASLLDGPGKTIYCAWLDRRRGFPLIYFSSSSDGGRTWGPNRPIEYDFREGDQIHPKLVRGTDGRILAFWEDYRDRQTLVDIRYAFSDDGGLHWSRSARINDDDEHVWQVSFDAISVGSAIYIAFSDFRDPGVGGDNDWNIYFAVSSDNGTTFGRNIRLNDALPGKDDAPKLAVDEDGSLFCIWRTERDSIFGDVAATFSKDGGATWAPSQVISKREKEGEIGSIDVISVGQGMIAAAWDREFYGTVESGSAVLGLVDAAVEPWKRQMVREPREPIPYRKGEQLYAEDFSDGGGAEWDEAEGVWMRVKGSYMGLAPGGRKPFSTFLKLPEPENYVLEGRFRLGEVSHFAANIFLRTDPSRRRYIVIGNRFRKGTWLGIKDDELPVGLHLTGGRVVLQRSYNFLSDRWYPFRVVVAGGRIDYFIDDRLVWSADLQDPPARGNVGLGGFENAPTSFDDISIHTLEP